MKEIYDMKVCAPDTVRLKLLQNVKSTDLEALDAEIIEHKVW